MKLYYATFNTDFGIHLVVSDEPWDGVESTPYINDSSIAKLEPCQRSKTIGMWEAEWNMKKAAVESIRDSLNEGLIKEYQAVFLIEKLNIINLEG